MVHRVVLGDVELFALVDAVPNPVPTTWSFPDVPQQAWSELGCAGLSAFGLFQPSLGCFLLQRGGSTILCDAGIGPGPNAYLDGVTGTLPDKLRECRVKGEEVDAVVFTHLHMDHVGWVEHGAERFPNATFMVPHAEHRYFASGARGMGVHHAEAFERTIGQLKAAGRLTLVGEDGRLPAQLTYWPTPGHTPGHCSIIAETEAGALVIAGDVFHCPAQVERPDWSHRADLDPALARQTRRAFLNRAAREGWTVAAGHFRDGLQFGVVVGDGGAFRYRPRTQSNGPAIELRAHHHQRRTT